MKSTIINKVQVVAFKDNKVFDILKDGQYMFFMGTYTLDSLTGRIYCPFKKKVIVEPELFRAIFEQDTPTLGMEIPNVGMFSVISKEKVTKESLPCFETEWNEEENCINYYPIEIKDGKFVRGDSSDTMPKEAGVWKTWFFFGDNPLIKEEFKHIDVSSIKTYKRLKEVINGDRTVNANDL